ncbi:MAG: TonB-dependent receptor [Bacteroidia bacterium]|nr:TonB-dependent receptor [Bacteroidia bacterium]
MHFSLRPQRKHLHRIAILLMCQWLWLPGLYATPLHAQNWEWVIVQVDLRQKSLVEIFDHLEAKTGFSFRYDQQVKTHQATYSLVYEEASVKVVLEDLAQQAGLHIRQWDHTITVAIRERKSVTVSAPVHIVSGQVTDATSGEGLEAVTVQVKGRQIGTFTDNQGRYSLEVPDPMDVLVLTAVGYEKAEEPLAGRTEVDIKLVRSFSDLEEVVVIGYGEQSRTKVTGAISRIGSDELNQYAGASFEQQLSGRLAGVQINQGNAQPGADAQIIIRGVGTLTAGRNPLIVVDGFPLTEGSSLSSVNPKDIESIDILKDAASAAIYGSRAGNGVIMIKTKKGAAGKPRVTLDVYSGIEQRSDKVRFVDAYDAAQFFTESRDWGYVSKNPAVRKETDDAATRLANGANKRELRLNYLQPYLDGQPGLTDTDWLDIAFGDAPISNYVLSVSGGNETSDYFVSGSYFNQEGIAIGSGFERYSGSVKVNSRLSDWLDFGISINPSYASQDFVRGSGNWNYDPVSLTNIMYPFFSPYNEDGSIAISEQIAANTPEDGALAENVLALLTYIKSDRHFFRTFGNTYLKFHLLKGLTFKTALGGDYRYNYFDFYDPSFIGQYRAAAPKPATASETQGNIGNYQLEHTLNYKRDIGQHSLDLLAGYTYQKETGAQTVVSGSGIPDDNLTNIAGASSYAISASRYSWVQISYLSRLQYAFDNRYLLTAAIRRDGSSRFGDNAKWGVFPSLSAGWIISQEAFFPQSTVFSLAKARVSWGKSGNNQIGSYGSQALVTADNYVYGTTLGSGFAATTSPNPDLSWETNTSFNAGLDLGFFDNRLTVSANYFNSITSDLLLNVPVPQQSGYSSSLTNIGEVQNTGAELEIAGNGIKIGDLTWSLGGNASFYHNEVLALAPGQTQIITGSNNAFITRVGHPIAELYGYNITGVYKTQEEISNTPHLNGTLTGDYIVEDINGDGAITTADRTTFGNYAPEFTYGFSSDLSWKNFGLSVVLAGVEGRRAYSRDLSVIQEVGEGFAVPNQYYFDNRYHPVNNPDGFFAQPNLGNFSAARRDTRASSIYFSDADYLRLRSAQLSYTLPTGVLTRIGLSQARVYVAGNNLFTLTSFRAFNPEGTTDNVLTAGYSDGNYPVARSIIGGITLSF